MKLKILVQGFIIILNLFCNPEVSSQMLTGRISISGAFALYPVAIRWSEEFRKIHPSVIIDISAGGTGKGVADVINGMVEIGMTSRDLYPEELKNNVLVISVAKDAVVAVMSDKNPSRDDILKTGLKKETGLGLWVKGNRTTWMQAFNVKATSSIHVYTRSDACGAAGIWAKYFGMYQEDLTGVGVFGDPGLIQAIKKDPYSIGYSNIAYVYDAITRKQINGISVVPLDLNNNGSIDDDENFYGNLNEMISAVAEGRYPSPPSRKLHFVCRKNQEKNPLYKEFLKWILKDGQKFIHEAGYISLSGEEVLAALKKLE